jgi:hypothetical protein
LLGQFEQRKLDGDERMRLNSLLVSKNLEVASTLQALSHPIYDQQPGTFTSGDDAALAEYLVRYGVGEDVGDFQTNLEQDIKDLGLVPESEY